MEELLRQGIAAARAGRREEARALLMRVVEQDEQNEQAWLWLSGVMDNPEDVRVCLENVLDLNPNNAKARQGLEWINARGGQVRQPAASPRATTHTTTPLGAVAVQPVSAPAAQPVSQPVAQPVSQPRIAVAAAAAQQNQPPVGDSAMASGQSPCPYCGAPTAAEAEQCPSCRTSLMIRDQPDPKPSTTLRVLTTVWWLGSSLLVIVALVLFVFALLVYQTLQFGADETPIRSNLSPLGFVTFGVVLLVIVGAAATLPRAWHTRAIWGYYAAIGVTLIWTLVALLMLLSGPGMLAAFGRDPAIVAILGAAAADLTSFAMPVGLFMLVGQVLIGVLLGLSYHDFVGPLRRFILSFERASHAEHYRNGVLYKSRGMWYAAAHEWESAVKRAPNDINYLRALSLAYARLKRIDEARAVLARALQIAPGHEQLLEDKVLIDRLAGAQDAGASRS